MPCAPIALDESPGTVNINRVPRIAETVVLETDSRLIAGRFAVTFDHHAMETSVAKEIKNILVFSNDINA